ncbi:MAG: T9SS type A sorting domain-containing protein, partial [Bacteroidetes bacterium]|nr:T9SS type A sorting domain-containing protein [Bacteroidota bacterium]
AGSYLWDFGDSTASTSINPVHLYPATGVYIVTLTATNVQCGSVSISDTITILIIESGGINIKNIVKVYPNPSRGHITVEIYNTAQSDLIIEIRSIIGQKIYSKVFRKENVIEQIDLSDFPNGIYPVKLITGEFTRTFKLILGN